MTKTVWHKGPPPEIGWWPASLYRDEEAIRWWDGEWSVPAYPDNTSHAAAKLARVRENIDWQRCIAWTERWWI